jgi:hypothetical protein
MKATIVLCMASENVISVFLQVYLVEGIQRPHNTEFVLFRVKIYILCSIISQAIIYYLLNCAKMQEEIIFKTKKLQNWYKGKIILAHDVLLC